MNICYVLGGFTNGGIGRVVSILANEQSNLEGYEVHVINLYKPDKREIYNLNSEIKRGYLLTKKCKHVRSIVFKSAKILRNYIKENNIDIVIACGNVFYPIALLASFKIAKTICWEHSNIFNTNDNKGQNILRFIASKFSDQVVTLTDYDKNGWIKKFKTKRIQRIYNPIDKSITSYIKEYDKKSKKIISVGRFGYQKHFDIVPLIAEKLLSYTEDWEWHIYGDGEMLESIRDELNKKNLQQKVILKGQVNNIYELYNNYSFMVMTSRYEGFPMTLLEGSANSLPLISFDVATGPNEIIEENKNGFLVELDDIDILVEKINEILSNDSLREEMSLYSGRKSKKFNINTILEEWDKLFKRIK